MAIKMRILYASGKKKIQNIANAIKTQYELAFNSVDVIPPAYSCDKERIVILAISGKGDMSNSLRLFCRELTKARAQNVALMIDGDEAIANKLKETLAEAGTNVIDEVLYVKGGLPIIGGSVKPEEKTAIFEWVDRVIANLK
ncbi:MAG: hypothetical protein IKC31_06310 [Clostridia bacterium]|nr:hypothetical protein [Clostridia bacterium]MBR2927172.1 hypothetical protein [Clostridia bacterium]